MPCIKIEHGYLCCDNDPISLEPYGAKVWMVWHNYMGPTFFRSVNRITPIIVPSKKTWDAFDLWRLANDK